MGKTSAVGENEQNEEDINESNADNKIKEGDVGPWERKWSRERRCHYWQHSRNDTIMWSEPKYSPEDEDESEEEEESEENDSEEDSNDNDATGSRKNKKAKKEKKGKDISNIPYKPRRYQKNSPPLPEPVLFPVRFPPKPLLRLQRARHMEALEPETTTAALVRGRSSSLGSCLWNWGRTCS